jgi:hypothetical protein
MGFFMRKIDGPPSDTYGPIYSLGIPTAGAPCTAIFPHAEVAAQHLGSSPRAPVLAVLLRTTGAIDHDALCSRPDDRPGGPPCGALERSVGTCPSRSLCCHVGRSESKDQLNTQRIPGAQRRGRDPRFSSSRHFRWTRGGQGNCC